MKKVLLAILLGFCAFCLTHKAEAQTYGLHLISVHKPGAHMNTVTPGAYVLFDSGVTLGAYRNSESKFSTYAGYTMGENWQLTLGAVTGYNRPLLPMLVPSYRFQNGLRVSLIPNPFGQSALHLSLELR